MPYRHQAPKSRARTVIWVALLSLIALMTWAHFAQVDQVTRAQGTVIAQARTQEIQASDGGVVREILVQEGQEVKAGQLLLVLEEERAQASFDNSAAKVAALSARASRLLAETLGTPLTFDDNLADYPEYIQNQTALYNRRRQAIEEDVASLDNMLHLATQELEINEPLLQYGDVSQADIIRLRRQVADIQAQITNKENKYFEEAQAELTRTQEELQAEQELLRDRMQVLEEKRLYAPTVGQVNNINVTTIGGVVRPGDVIMELLPTTSDLILDTKVRPLDIAYVTEGMPATVKLDAYDYSIFGSLDGIVSYISPDTLMEKTPQGEVPYYKVQVSIGAPQLAKRASEITVRPGMTAGVEIKARQRSLLSYLTKPIVKTLDESLGER